MTGVEVKVGCVGAGGCESGAARVVRGWMWCAGVRPSRGDGVKNAHLGFKSEFRVGYFFPFPVANSRLGTFWGSSCVLWYAVYIFSSK